MQILYVFCVPLYTIKTYEIDGNTTVKDVQLLIEKDTNIKVEHQILTDYNGTLVLTESTALLTSKTDVCIINLYDVNIMYEIFPKLL